MQSHQSNLSALVIGIGIADQRRVIQELVQRLAPIAGIHSRVNQFA